MKGFTTKALWGLAFLLLLVVLFDVPSAYAVSAGKPRWLAWTVGVLALVVPLAWSIVGERKRMAAPAKPGTAASTTRSERIWLRTGFVALLVVGGLFGMARGKAWYAVRHHAFWFVPYSPSPLDPSSDLLARVPADAQAIIWVRDTAEARAALGQLMPTAATGDFEIVLAFTGDGKKALVMERGDAGLVDKVAQLAQAAGSYAGVKFAPAYNLPDGTRVWSTEGWGVSSSPPTALVERMRGANDDAFLVGVVDDPKLGASGLAWVGGHAGILYVAVDGKARDEARAKALVDEFHREIGKKPEVGQCFGEAEGTGSFTNDGPQLRGEAEIQVSELFELFACLDAKR